MGKKGDVARKKRKARNKQRNGESRLDWGERDPLPRVKIRLGPVQQRVWEQTQKYIGQCVLKISRDEEIINRKNPNEGEVFLSTKLAMAKITAGVSVSVDGCCQRLEIGDRSAYVKPWSKEASVVDFHGVLEPEMGYFQTLDKPIELKNWVDKAPAKVELLIGDVAILAWLKDHPEFNEYVKVLSLLLEYDLPWMLPTQIDALLAAKA